MNYQLEFSEVTTQSIWISCLVRNFIKYSRVLVSCCFLD